MKPQAQYDATGEVDLQDPAAVERAIAAILDSRYGDGYDRALLAQAVADACRAYRGEYPGLLRCDTLYHDLRHALETGLTAARILDGHQRTAPADEAVDAEWALLVVLLAIYHDIGMLRRPHEADLWGPVLTPIHEERGVEFMRGYLAGTSLAHLADKSILIMPTKLVFTIPADWPAADRRLGSMIAAADILSQLADRCYIEKCRDFLFREFGAIGLAGSAGSPYPDPETLLAKTPGFYTGLIEKRLEGEYGGIHRAMPAHFGGADPYGDAIRRNLDYLGRVLAEQDFSLLRRVPQRYIGG